MNEIVTSQSNLITSPQINEIAEALAAAQGEFPVIKKNKSATVRGESSGGRSYEYEYAYADLGDIAPAIMPILSKHGLCYIQPTTIEGGTIFIHTRLIHRSGQFFESEYPVASYERTPHQKIGAALTYSKRYALCALLGIVAEEDTDAAEGAATVTDKPAPKSRARREPPAVVQGSEGGKPLPPVVGKKNPPTFTLHDEANKAVAFNNVDFWIIALLDHIGRLQDNEEAYRAMWAANEEEIERVRHIDGVDMDDVFRNHHLVLEAFEKAESAGDEESTDDETPSDDNKLV